MNACLEYIEKLKKATYSDDLRCQLIEKRESYQENAKKVLGRYGEEWRYVLSYLEEFMRICLETLDLLQPFDPLFEMTLDFLFNVANCITNRRIYRYWPTEVSWLPKLVDWTSRYLDLPETDVKSKNNENWTSVYVLVLWLSAAVKTPFELSRFDTSDNSVGSNQVSISNQLIAVIKSTLNILSLSAVAHVLAGNFFSRPDTSKLYLKDFIDFLLANISTAPITKKFIYLRVLATLLKTVERSVLQPFVCDIVKNIFPIVETSHEVQTKLSIKILGRCALCQIKPRLIKWRYSVGRRVISSLENPNSKIIKDDGENVDLSLIEQKISEDQDEEITLDQLDLPEYFEKLFQLLVTNINHSSTMVRYSVAKYLSSICSRLPQQFSLEILSYVCGEMCITSQDDFAWHGGCLTLAEFVRRGYVAIDFMPKVIEVVKQALFYEHIKGSFSLGAHVRDSAAYICWSLARAYESNIIEPFVEQLAPLLLCLACFDRQLNCRRAASAVIQELAGRTQKFPHWIEVIGKLEFHELTKIDYTFNELGVYFAEFPVFQQCIVDHLVIKCCHWDAAIRRLASQALGNISRFVDFATIPALDKLLEKAISKDLNARHGCILAISFIIREDSTLVFQKLKREQLKTFIETIVQYLKSTNLLLGMGGELMRESSLSLIESYFMISKNETIHPDLLNCWLDFLVESIGTIEKDALQEQLVQTSYQMIEYLQTHSDALLVPKDKIFTELSTFLNRNDQYPSSTVAKIFSIARVGDSNEQVLQSLILFIQNNFGSPLRRAETLAEIIKALANVSANFYDQLSEDDKSVVVNLLVQCLDDHTITVKGDTGLFVRIASIEASLVLSTKLNASDYLRVFQLITSEAAFIRNRSFKLALSALTELSQLVLTNQKLAFKTSSFTVPVEYLEMIVQIPSLQANFHLLETSEQYQKLINLLSCPVLCRHLLPGFVCILADPIMDRHKKLITDYILAVDQQTRTNILETFIQFFEDNVSCARLVGPCMASVQQLLLHVPFPMPQYESRLCKITWEACKVNKSVKKYMLGCDIWCALVSLSALNLKVCFSYLYVLLGGREPRVRQYTATQMYTSLLSIDLDDDEDKADSLMQIITILQETDWLVDTDAKMARDQVKALINSLAF